MGFFSELNDEELIRLLRRVEDELVEAPAPPVERAHVAAMLEESRNAEKSEPVARPASKAHGPTSQVSGLPKWRVAMQRTKATAVKLGAGAIAASLSTMGLAYAGVDLPGGAAEKAFETVGIHLPNQGEDETHGKSVSEDVRRVIEESEERGCEFGRAVSEVASQNRRGEGGGDAAPCAQKGAEEEEAVTATSEGATKGDEGKARAEQKSNGHAKADEAPRGGKERSGEGKARAEERSGGKAKADEFSSERSGKGSGDSGGKGSGDEASSKGRARAEQRGNGSGGDEVEPEAKKPEGAGKQA